MYKRFVRVYNIIMLCHLRMGENKMLNDGERIKLGNKVLAITIALNVVLTIIKVIAGLKGNSSAMVAAF